MAKLDQVVIEFRGNNKDLDKSLKDTEKGIKRVSTEGSAAMGRLSQSFKEALDPVRALQGGFAALGTAAVVAGIGALINKSDELQQKFRDISTLTDMTAQQMGNLKDQIQLVALDTQTRSIDLAAAQYNILSAGITDAAQSMEVLQKSAELAKVGISTPLEAVNIMTSAINAFGVSADVAADTIFATVQAGKTTVSDLAMSFGNVASVASATGVSFQELQAATAALTLTGQTASIAQNALKAAIANILTPTKDASEEIKRLNKNTQGIHIEFSAAALQAKGFTRFLDELIKVTGGNTDSLKQLFGSIEAYNAILGLATTQSQAYHDILGRMDKSAGLVRQTMDKQKNTIQEARIVWDEFGNVAGDALAVSIEPALRNVNAILKDFITLTNGATSAVDKFNARANFLDRLLNASSILTSFGGPLVGLVGFWGRSAFGLARSGIGSVPKTRKRYDPKNLTGQDLRSPLERAMYPMINLLPTVAAQPPETTGPPPSGSGSSGGKKKTQAEKDMDFVRSLLPDTQKLDIQINKLNEAMKRGTIPARDYAAAMKELTDQKMDAAAEEFKKLHPELAKFILTTEKVKEVSDKAIGPALKKLEELGDVTQNLDYRRMEMFRSILESTWTEGERTANQLKLLFQIYSEGTITLEQYQEAVDRIADANLRASIAADSSVNQMQEDMGKLADFVDSAGKNVEDALIGAFMTGEFSFKEMVASMLEQLSRLVLEILVIEPIFGRIADALRGGGGAKGSGIAGVFKGIAGLFSLGKGGKVPLPGKAAGGPVYGGSPYMVGEKGPELFIPGMSGTIIPNGAGVGSGMTFHQTINISPGLSGQIRAEIAAAMPQIKRDTTRGVMEGIQRGGRLAQAVGRKS